MARSGTKTALVLATLVATSTIWGACAPSDRGKQIEQQPEERTEYPPPYGQEGLAQAAFDVDPLLLGFTYEDSTLGLRFSPPRGWAAVEDLQFERVRLLISRFFEEGETFQPRPERIFFDEGRMIFMVLSSFEFWPTPGNPFLALTEYRRLVNETMPDMTIQAELFQVEDIAFYQLQMSNPVAVNRRLILIREDHLPVRVDYISPKGLYQDLVASIEASIGSFRSLEQ
jgi:hypothetical protein